jgi:hypothetical protein
MFDHVFVCLCCSEFTGVSHARFPFAGQRVQLASSLRPATAGSVSHPTFNHTLIIIIVIIIFNIHVIISTGDGGFDCERVRSIRFLFQKYVFITWRILV